MLICSVSASADIYSYRYTSMGLITIENGEPKCKDVKVVTTFIHIDTDNNILVIKSGGKRDVFNIYSFHKDKKRLL